MPIEGTVNRIADLDSRWPRNADIVREGAAHLRNIKTALKQLMEDEVGTVKMFYGDVADIPVGWAICDGQNGTPNMQNRVPVGTGDQYALGASGGADTVTLSVAQLPQHGHSGQTENGGVHSHSGNTSFDGVHSHSGSTDNDSHSHGGGSTSGSIDITGSSTFRIVTGATTTGGNTGTLSGFSTDVDIHNHSLNINNNGNHNHGLNINNSPAHKHTVTVGNTGGGEAHENRMPYRALHFIMKIEE